MIDMNQNNYHDRIPYHKYSHKHLYMKRFRISSYKIFCYFFYNHQNMTNHCSLHRLYYNYLYSYPNILHNIQFSSLYVFQIFRENVSFPIFVENFCP